jgi:hypothetical protein
MFPPETGGWPFRQMPGGEAPPVDSGATHHLPSSVVFAGVGERGRCNRPAPRATVGRGFLSIRLHQERALIRPSVERADGGAMDTCTRYLDRWIVSLLAPGLQTRATRFCRKEERKERKLRIFLLLLLLLFDRERTRAASTRDERATRSLAVRPPSESPALS